MCSPARDLTAGYHAVSPLLIMPLRPSLISANSGDTRQLLIQCESPGERHRIHYSIIHRGNVLAEAEDSEEILHVNIGMSNSRNTDRRCWILSQIPRCLTRHDRVSLWPNNGDSTCTPMLVKHRINDNYKHDYIETKPDGMLQNFVEVSRSFGVSNCHPFWDSFQFFLNLYHTPHITR